MGGRWPLTALDDVQTLVKAGWLGAPAVLPPSALPMNRPAPLLRNTSPVLPQDVKEIVSAAT